MIRCIKLWSGRDGHSHFEEGVIDLEPGQRGDTLSGKFPIASCHSRKRIKTRSLDGIRTPRGSSSSR